MKNLFIIILIGLFTTSCSWLQNDPFAENAELEEPKETTSVKKEEEPTESPLELKEEAKNTTEENK